MTFDRSSYTGDTLYTQVSSTDARRVAQHSY